MNLKTACFWNFFCNAETRKKKINWDIWYTAHMKDIFTKSDFCYIAWLRSFSYAWRHVHVIGCLIWGSQCFLNLIPDILHRKIVAAVSLYLALFKLNLKDYHGCSSLGPATSQKRFKYTFQQCIILKQDWTANLKKVWIQLWKKTLAASYE